ncbi:hypothetical protein [Amycolatopsis sp. WAC 04169]|uniref:hypothetical protein n=1 Tax=Amycolatopsis sp. WAC 04169 TaxID=2203197 RepID=UPI00131547D0|nr:hypothetical protein [Amycolatopsis sp. WAC 04169]
MRGFGGVDRPGAAVGVNSRQDEMPAGLTPEQRKVWLGEALLPRVQRYQPVLAAQVSGRLLKLSADEILALLADEPSLERKIAEATEELARKHQHD